MDSWFLQCYTELAKLYSWSPVLSNILLLEKNRRMESLYDKDCRFLVRLKEDTSSLGLLLDCCLSPKWCSRVLDDPFCFSLSKRDAKKVRVELVVAMFFLGTLEWQCVATSQNQKRTPTWIGVDECPQSRWKQVASKFRSCNVVGLNKAQETKFTPRDWGILDVSKAVGVIHMLFQNTSMRTFQQ